MHEVFFNFKGCLFNLIPNSKFMYGKDYPNVPANIFAKYKRRVLFTVLLADFYQKTLIIIDMNSVYK